MSSFIILLLIAVSSRCTLFLTIPGRTAFRARARTRGHGTRRHRQCRMEVGGIGKLWSKRVQARVPARPGHRTCVVRMHTSRAAWYRKGEKKWTYSPRMCSSVVTYMVACSARCHGESLISALLVTLSCAALLVYVSHRHVFMISYIVFSQIKLFFF